MVRAQSNAAWLRHIAARYEQPIVQVARTLRTSRALIGEAAIILNEAAQREARRLVEGDGKPPTGGDLFDALVRCHYAPLMEQKKERARAAARAALTAEMKAQQREKKGT